jgi:signal peptidase I
MNSTTKKVLNISLKVIAGLLVAFTVGMMIFTVISVSTFDRNDRSVLGFKFYIVQSDSMSPSENNKDMDVHFSVYDVIVIKEQKDNTVFQAGDVISFISANKANWGETVTHMIREVRKNDEGKVIGYVTFGTNTGVNDEELATPDYVLGKYVGKLPGVGKFFNFMQTTPGYLLCILVPFLLLILYNGVNVIRLFRQYKKEQTAVLNAEKEEVAAERKQNEAMLRELLALKEQLARQSGGTTVVEAQEPEASPQETTASEANEAPVTETEQEAPKSEI